MSFARQGVSFLAVGFCLILLDWVVFVGLTALSVPAVPANIAGRVAGALVGFWANGRITFAGDGARLGRHHFARYLMSWTVLTLLSTVLVNELADHLSLQVAWLAKPVVEAGLAGISFFLSRHWVYR